MPCVLEVSVRVNISLKVRIRFHDIVLQKREFELFLASYVCAFIHYLNERYCNCLAKYKLNL